MGSQDSDRLVAQVAVEHFGPATERAMKMIVKHLFLGADRDSDTIDTLGMLATMAVEGKSIPTAVLENFGVASAVVARSSEQAPAIGDLSAAELAAAARTEVNWLRHGYLGPEHLLLGICCCNGSRGRELLSAVGMQPTETCYAVLEILGHDDQWTEWLAAHPGLRTTEPH
jgi:hypothetical protein